MELQEDGIYPVRALKDKILQWFIKIGDTNTIEHELKYNGLNKRFKYKVTNGIITDIAEVNPSGPNQIIVYENFCQFLWSFSYAIIVIFDEAFIRPRVEQNFNFSDSKLLDSATKSIETAFELFTNPKPDKFFILPNPESSKFRNDKQVQVTEDVFCIGLSFILFHEFGHHFLGHLGYKPDTNQQRKKEEEDADDYAFEILSKHFNEEYCEAIKTGIIISLIALVFEDDTLSGGDAHPDPHQRLKRIFEKMGLDENNDLWALASVAFKLWAFKYNKPLEFPESVESYKELFDRAFIELNYLKNPF